MWEVPANVAWRAEWIFRRRSDRCTLRRIQEEDGRCILSVNENGQERAYAFSEPDRLIAFQSDMEAFLVRTGWALESFSPERRTGRDRRRSPRVDNDRRRWWTDPAPTTSDE